MWWVVWTGMVILQMIAQLTRGIGPMLFWCWAVVDGGPTSEQQWVNQCLVFVGRSHTVFDVKPGIYWDSIWASVADDVPALAQQWINDLCLQVKDQKTLIYISHLPSNFSPSWNHHSFREQIIVNTSRFSNLLSTALLNPIDIICLFTYP